MESKSEQRLNVRDGSVGFLQTLETSLDDIRNLVTCRVCIRPLFEPYTIECGHTFCYGCLLRWFERDRTKKSCPDCRAEIIRPPAPAYLVISHIFTFVKQVTNGSTQVRDMTQIFANRAELMPPGETTEDHQKWQKEEAAAVEKDRSTTGRRGGLFRGCFRVHIGRPPLIDYIRQPIIRDVEDGVDRCPRCTWELEDGLCHSCGYPSEGEEWSDSEALEHFHPDDVYGDEDDMESAIIDALVDGGDMPPGFGREYTPASPSERSYSSEDDGIVGRYGVPPDDELRLPAPHMRARRTLFPDELSQDAGTPYDSMQEESDEGSEDGDEAGSLDSFVVDDVEEQPHSPSNSVERVLWDSDEDSEAEVAHTQLSQYSDQSHERQEDSGSDQNEISSIQGPAARYHLVEDSDEGPNPPSRRQLARGLAASHVSSGGDSSPPMIADHRRRRRNDSHRNMTSNTQIQRSIAHHSRNRRTSGNSNGAPIEIDSDSDAPVSASQPTRRSRVHASLFTEEDSGAETSSGTATVGRPSPGSRPSRRQKSPANPRPNTESSPIMIKSSPRRAGMDDSGTLPRYGNVSEILNQLPSLLPESRPQHGSGLPQQASASTNGGFHSSGPSILPTSPPLPSGQSHRRLSPVPPRSQHRSPASGSSNATTAQEDLDQVMRQRQIQKAERKTERRRIKAERDRRRGEMLRD